ncbi:MAG: phage holin family protein [Gammaproteobacteria bacterium]|nr:phage holin family protein [Gammaproteobacteria bacterium]
MNLIVKIVLTALAVFGVAYLLDGAEVRDFVTALIVAVVLAVLNTFLKPMMKIVAIPITILTFGLFLFVINAALIMIASHFVDGFFVDGFWWALLFSVVLSVVVSFLESVVDNGKRWRWKW